MCWAQSPRIVAFCSYEDWGWFSITYQASSLTHEKCKKYLQVGSAPIDAETKQFIRTVSI